MATPEQIYNRYLKGLKSQAPNVTRDRITNMRIALNRELQEQSVPAEDRRAVDDRFTEEAQKAFEGELP